MKKDIHAQNYRLVVFKDATNGDMFLTGSTIATTETVKYTDGKEYPLYTGGNIKYFTSFLYRTGKST
jgi:large subunit ribosomal protein L31